MNGVGAGSVYTDLSSLERLKSHSRTDREAALREVASQFEAVFVQMVLKHMREANLAEGLFDSNQVQTYRQLFDKQVSLELADGRGLGLSEMIVQQLGHAVRQLDTTPAAAGAEASARPSVSPQQAGYRATWRPDDPEAFVEAVLPHARRAAEALGTEPEAVIAQAALETGWGQHVIERPDGSSSFNLFGIKAGPEWSGDRVTVPTLEYIDGVAERRRESFRAYGSLAESFDDYVAHVQGSGRYQAALQAEDGRAFVNALQAGGYATDPAYATKIIDLMEGETLKTALGGFKS